MRIFDLIKIAARNLKGRWAVLPAAGIAVSVFCLCFAGAVLTAVQEEKSLPYELNIAPGDSGLSDGVIAEISEVPDVTAVTPVLLVPVSIKTDEYSAQLTLTGISAAYLNGEFREGGAFPQQSIMPYLVLNEAACKTFSNNPNDNPNDMDIGTETEAPEIDWLNTEYSMQAGEGLRPVITKVSGILADEEEQQEPFSYISVSSAKGLLQQSGQGTDYAEAKARIKNIGCAKSVSNAITGLGLSVVNYNEELQAQWDAEMGETTYLIIIGIFCMLCSLVLMAAWRRISISEHKEAYLALLWVGIKSKDIGRLFVMQAGMICLTGVVIGVLVGMSLPSFLSQEPNGTSVFTLPVPFLAAALSSAVCIIAGMVPMINISKGIAHDLR